MVPRPSARTLLLLLAVAAAAAPGASAVRALDSADSLPDRVHAYGSARVGEDLYLVGGGRGSAYLDEIVRLGPDGAATQVASLPEAIKAPAAAAHDGTVYVFGGATRSADSNLPQTQADVYRFDPDSGEVDRLLDARLPDPVSSAAAVPVDGAIYVLGGLSIQPNADDQVDRVATIARFDPGDESVTELDAELPTGRAQASAVAADGDVLYFGGEAEGGPSTCAQGRASCFVGDVLRFRPGPGSVGQIGTLPTPVRWSAAALHEGTAYVLGGCAANCGPHEGVAAVQTVNASTGSARELPVTMPVTGGRNDAILHEDTAWLPGGVRATSEGSRDHARVLRVELGPTRPWAPTNLTGEATEAGVELSWSPPDYDGGSPVTGYVVERGRGAQAPTRLDRAAGTGYVDENASQGVTYTYRVRAANAEGLSSPGGEALVRPTETPEAPRVSATGGDGKLVAQWSPPEDTGGLNVTGYRVFAYPANRTPNLDDCGEACWGEVSEATRRVEIRTAAGSPVQNGQTYTVRLQARNPNGWGAASPPHDTTPKPVPDAPTDLRAQANRSAEPSVELTWTPPDGEASDYVVHRGPALDELSPLATTTETRHTDRDPPEPGRPAVYAVAARNGDAEGPISEPRTVVFPRAPDPVTRLEARWTGSHVQVAWEAPNETGGRPIQAYEVARTRGATDPGEANATIDTTAVQRWRDENPPRGTPVTYHVRAVTEAGEGPWAFQQVHVPLTQDSRPPSPALAAHPQEVDVGSRVVFDASGSEDDEELVAYDFAFGDGQRTGWRPAPRATHAYDEAGVYEANVTVRDASGLEGRAEATIAVGPPPEPDPAGPEPNGSGEDPGAGSPNNTPTPAAAAILAALSAALWARRS